MKLSPRQIEALHKLGETGTGSAYGMGVSLATLEVLARHNLAQRVGKGHGFFPRIGTWQITPRGRVKLSIMGLDKQH